ncbi:forkhead box protein R1 isoform X1 [Pezoporus flaviventris]|uniref:forkhead box protein R1 isoform X1 n=2 Tax=Pezoporus flaviventris TaxID=889875 RepID=UPI002AAF9485|nr:forkhead box protein R1 isoform X1 [Pezoporus flaviventris]XP_061334101.1 forkhead box protein R1 isoform X1 [Pezoporus flaviventris]
MDLSFQNKAFWESLHLQHGLEDWDMAEELKLTSTEEIRQGQGAQPHLWMWVNPSLACPLPGSPGSDPATSKSLVSSVAGATGSSSLNTSWDNSCSDLNCSKEDVLSPSSKARKLTADEAASCVDIPVPQEMLKSPEVRMMLVPWKSTVLSPQSMKLKCPRQMSAKIEGGWPRPPLNYCTLISIALCNSAGGSLTVQQIYQFTRQHFPFFQTAPKGWKSMIRHKLCFSSCFEKSTSSTCAKGNHRSCLWKLTPGGCRKFQEEAQALTKEALDLVCQSMSNPGTIPRAGALQTAGHIRFYEVPAAGEHPSTMQPPALGDTALGGDIRNLEIPAEMLRKQGSVIGLAKSPTQQDKANQAAFKHRAVISVPAIAGSLIWDRTVAAASVPEQLFWPKYLSQLLTFSFADLMSSLFGL